MPTTHYRTATQTGEGEFKDRGSKFIGYAVHVTNEDSVKQHIEQLQEQHPKSRHVCYAFRIGIDDITERANDDGEPSGSAGMPILNQLYSFEATNTLVAVVRYFGGTKLGVPGLIHAYKTAARVALERASVAEREVMTCYHIQCHYQDFNEVIEYLKASQAEIVEQTLTDDARFTVAVPRELTDTFESRMNTYDSLQLNYQGLQ